MQLVICVWNQKLEKIFNFHFHQKNFCMNFIGWGSGYSYCHTKSKTLCFIFFRWPFMEKLSAQATYLLFKEWCLPDIFLYKNCIKPIKQNSSVISRVYLVSPTSLISIVKWHVWWHVCYYIDPKFTEFLLISHFFGIGSASFYFLLLKLSMVLTIKNAKKERRQTENKKRLAQCQQKKKRN